MSLVSRTVCRTLAASLALVALFALPVFAETLAKRAELASEPFLIQPGKQYELQVKFRDNLKMRATAAGSVTVSREIKYRQRDAHGNISQSPV